MGDDEPAESVHLPTLAQEKCALDKAFALIEAFWEACNVFGGATEHHSAIDSMSSPEGNFGAIRVPLLSSEYLTRTIRAALFL